MSDVLSQMIHKGSIRSLLYVEIGLRKDVTFCHCPRRAERVDLELYCFLEA